jgi:hypothetical protein
MPRYLISLTDENAAKLESRLGGALRIIPAWGDSFSGPLIASLDAVADKELEPVLDRLAAGVSMYHHGGPPGSRGKIHRAGCDELCTASGPEAALKRYAEKLAERAGPDPYGGRGIRVGDHWEPPIGAMPGDRLLMGYNGTCTANARRGTGTGICDRPLDELGQCDRASDHI